MPETLVCDRWHFGDRPTSGRSIVSGRYSPKKSASWGEIPKVFPAQNSRSSVVSAVPVGQCGSCGRSCSCCVSRHFGGKTRTGTWSRRGSPIVASPPAGCPESLARRQPPTPHQRPPSRPCHERSLPKSPCPAPPRWSPRIHRFRAFGGRNDNPPGWAKACADDG
jgi:hypothetical protein